MNSNKQKLLMLACLALPASGCMSLPQSAPPVQVVETCPRAPHLPQELTEPLPDFLNEISSTLTDFYGLELKPTKQLGSVTSR